MGGYNPVVIEEFGGVLANYRANVPGRATLASQNFLISQDGRSVRSRQGFDNFTASGGANAYVQLYAHADGSRVLARRTSTLAAIDTSGAEVATTTVSSSNFVHAARFGTPSAAYSYIADGSTALIRYDGTSFSAGTSSATVDGSGSQAMPKGNFLTVTGSSNRLVVAGTAASGGPGGATSGGSYVWFSDPGSAETWDSDNYVQLDPGDGEAIMGCVTWRDQVFVFKQTKLYIFYSESTDAAGNPVFNYRSVALGNSAQCKAPDSVSGNPSVVATPDGVFYIGLAGVWLTTGDVPTSVSDEAFGVAGLDPSPSTGLTSSTSYLGFASGIHHHLGRLYIPAQSVGRVLVYDISSGAWSIWAASVYGFQTWATVAGGEPKLFSGDSSGGKHVLTWSSLATTYTDDNGTAIVPIYQTSWWDLGLYGEKTVREVEIWGGGTISVTLYSDFVASGTTSSVSLGSASSALTSTRGFHTASVTGNYFALNITASSYFRIDRIILHLRDAKNVGAKSS